MAKRSIVWRTELDQVRSSDCPAWCWRNKTGIPPQRSHSSEIPYVVDRRRGDCPKPVRTPAVVSY